MTRDRDRERAAEVLGNHGGEDLVQHAHKDQRQDRNNWVRQLFFGDGLGLIAVARAVALAARYGLAAAPFQVSQADDQNENSADDTEPRRSPRIGLEEGGGNDVLDLWTARQRVHGEGERTQRDSAGNQAFGNAALAEHLRGEGIYREHHHEQRHAAVGEHRAHHHDRKHGALATDQLDHRGNDRLGKSRQLDDLAENRSQHEYGE